MPSEVASIAAQPPLRHHVVAFGFKPLRSDFLQDFVDKYKPSSPQRPKEDYPEPSRFERLMFDTGAAIHICPPWFGEEYGVYFTPDIPQIHGIDDSGPSGIQVHGWRTVPLRFVCRDLNYMQHTLLISVTFVVCDCFEPIIPVRDLLDLGIKT